MSEPLKMFYIQNLGYCGDCLKWWREGGHGYTLDLNEAWKLPEDAARDICRSRPHEDIPWPADIAEAALSQHVNSENPIAKKFMMEGAAERRRKAREDQEALREILGEALRENV
jgi:hypothetical protein